MNQFQIKMPGRIFLVGAGPGDPGLITVRGREILRQADALVYDYLTNPVLLDEARPGCEIIYVGKSGSQHTMSQAGINALLIRLAGEGKVVARLKGGDPFVFGRGGEEAQALHEAGITFEVVPGVSSAVAVAAYAGIPVTHRHVTSSFTVITGHEDISRSADESRLNWPGLVRAGGTLVFLMGVGHLAEITANLIAAGQSPQTPVAVVRWGTLWQQQTVTGDLSNIAERARQAGIKPPAVTIVGEVVALREQLRWFDLPSARPLLGKRIVLCHPLEQADALSATLSASGAQCIRFPRVNAVALAHPAQLEQAISRLSQYDWLIFSTKAEVEFFLQSLQQSGKDSRTLAGRRIGAVGPAALAALEQRGLAPDLVLAEVGTQPSLAQMSGQKILLTTSQNQPSGLLAETLIAQGAIVEQLAVYITEVNREPTPGGTATAELAWLLEAGQLDLVSFGSAQAVDYFQLSLAGTTELSLAALLSQTGVICYDADTYAKLADHSVTAFWSVQPENLNIVTALVEYFETIPSVSTAEIESQI